ncbi:iron ABC transporter permease, partial [Pectobacterium versatile]
MTNVSYSETTTFTAPSPPLRKPAALLTIVALTLSLLGFVPLGFVIGVSIDTGWETARTLLFRPRVGELLTNTVLLVVLTLPICTVLGVLLAWLA